MKNYRILRLTNACHYPGVERQYLTRINPNWSSQSYFEQKAIWDAQFYVYGDSLSYWMKRRGNEAMDIVVDSISLQSSWARERNIDTSTDTWRLDTILAQIGMYKPDVLYLQDIHAIPANVRKDLKTIFPFIKVIVIFRGYPGGNLSYLANFCDADLLLVGAPQLVDKFSQLGSEAHLVYHSFDHRINRFLSKVPNENKIPFSFIGTLGFGSPEHQERANLLNMISTASDLTVYSDDPWRNVSGKIRTVEVIGGVASGLIRYPLVKKVGRQLLKYKHLFPRNVKSYVKKMISRGNVVSSHLRFGTAIFPGVHGLSMYQALASSKISFNVHSNAGRGAVENMRMFQATGVGSCLLTDWGKNITDLFEPDKEVVCYKTPEECIDKLRQLQSNDKLCAEIAKNGQLRVQRDHTTEKRVEQIHALIAGKL
jgi:spore maturation protein CgeB